MSRRPPRLEFSAEPDTDELIDQDLEEILNDAEAVQRRSLAGMHKVEAEFEELPDIKKLEEDQRAQLLHVETLTMMAKYQYIFIKMEGFLRMLTVLFRQKRTSCLVDGFYALARNRCSKRQRTIIRSHLVQARLQTAFSKLEVKLRCSKLSPAFEAIHNVVQFQKCVDGLTQKELKLQDALHRAVTKKGELGDTLKKKQSRRKSGSRSKIDLLKGPSENLKLVTKQKVESLELDMKEQYSKLRSTNLMIKKNITVLQQEVMTFLLDINSAMDNLSPHKK